MEDETAARGRPKLGIPLARREVDTEARLGTGFALTEANGVLERTRDARELFFCRADAGGGSRAMDDIDGFLRSCSVEAGARSCDWLPEGLSTGSRDDAGLGRPDGRGIEDAGSMVGPAVRVDVATTLTARNACPATCSSGMHRQPGFGPSSSGQFETCTLNAGAGCTLGPGRERELALGCRCPVRRQSSHVSRLHRRIGLSGLGPLEQGRPGPPANLPSSPPHAPPASSLHSDDNAESHVALQHLFAPVLLPHWSHTVGDSSALNAHRRASLQ